MADRRTFIGAVSGAAASVLLATNAQAEATAPEAPPKPSPPPSPKPSVSPKPPSAAAAAIAATMRRFDPQLTDEDLDTIAHAIDDNVRRGKRLHPNGATALKNGEEPITRFSVAPGAR